MQTNNGAVAVLTTLLAHIETFIIPNVSTSLIFRLETESFHQKTYDIASTEEMFLQGIAAIWSNVAG